MKLAEIEYQQPKEELKNPEETFPIEMSPPKVEFQDSAVASISRSKGRITGKKAALQFDAASSIFKLGNLSEITSPSKRSGRGRPSRYNPMRIQFRGIQDMHQLIELGYQEQRSRNIEPTIPSTFVKRDFTPNINLTRGLPVI